ncbi:uncharacterized protein LOC132726922 [Ruditapes philippinarum]|uniref:uncharacterized protein LOC132726922 n=1 Tax=Ruditapes philippinarum TaxID=129788 RepID=UPI00295A6E6C|nr:uncharacterized protein LOC132726922 [Ruditapes philippinarum]
MKVQDVPHCCPTCGQQWLRDKPEISASDLKVFQWDCLPHNDIEKKSKSPLLSSENDYMSGLKRSSSFVHKRRSQTQNNSRSSRVIKAASLMNDPIRSPWTQSESKFRRLASKESTKSAPSLKRCLSYNVDSFRSARGDTGEDVNSINYSKEQRSSFRRDTSCENDTGCEETASCPGSEYDDIIKYSPKLTKETKFVNGCPIDEFKTIFDAECFRIPSIYGQLKIMFQLFNDTSEFQVTILEGSNVAVENESGNIGIYTKICFMPGKLQKKTGRDKHSTRNPVFYESFIFKTSLAQLLESQLKIKLYNKPGILSIPEPIGQCIVPLYNYDLTAVNVIWQNLQKCKGQKDDMDEFDFSYFERDKVKKKRQLGKFLCGYSSPE